MKRLSALLSALTMTVAPTLVATPPAAAAPAVVLAAPGAGATPAEVAPRYHVVRPGETIRSIAAAHDLKRRHLRAWNDLRKPNEPRVDGVLNLAKPVTGRLSGWRSHLEAITPEAVDWDPARRCPVPPAALRKVWVTYIDFYGASHQGSIVVHRAIASRTQRAFRALYRMRFRIQGMSPMTQNAPYISDMGTVTAGYNCRTVGGTDTWSQHAYGTAIDVNPVQNPMVRGSSVDPVAGRAFLRRDVYRRGMMHAAGAVRAFTDQGLHWGGRWHSLKDDMHFSLNDR